MFAESSLSSHEAFYGAAATFLLVLAREVVGHFKERKKGGVLAGIDRKLDASIREQRTFVDEQRKTNERFDSRISGAYYLLTGANDEHGENGVRGDTRVLKGEMDELKRRGVFNTPPERPRLDPRDVGSFSPPRSA